jgi:hypothetical protein
MGIGWDDLGAQAARPVSEKRNEDAVRRILPAASLVVSTSPSGSRDCVATVVRRWCDGGARAVRGRAGRGTEKLSARGSSFFHGAEERVIDRIARAHAHSEVARDIDQSPRRRRGPARRPSFFGAPGGRV